MENSQTHPPKKITKEHKDLIDSLLAVEFDHKDWELIYAESNIIIEKKKKEVNCVMPLKLHAILPGISFKHLAEMIIVPEMRQKWDHLQGFDIIEKVSENEDVIYTYIKVSKISTFWPKFPEWEKFSIIIFYGENKLIYVP